MFLMKRQRSPHPWGTLLLICGVGVLMNVIILTGGIDLLSDALASIMSDSSAVSILGITAGVLRGSPTSGVVMPTLHSDRAAHTYADGKQCESGRVGHCDHDGLEYRRHQPFIHGWRTGAGGLSCGG